jgi:hypothetical protein
MRRINDHSDTPYRKGDRIFRERGDRINEAKAKNMIAEEIRSQAFISGLLIEKAIAFQLKNAIACSDEFSVSVLKQHGSK